MPKAIDVRVGDTYSRLTVLTEPYSVRKPSGRCERFVTCKCSCGEIKTVSLNKLRMKKTLSCGCYNKEMVSRRKISDSDRVKNSLIREYKISADCRKLDYSLSDDLIFSTVKKPCHYCGTTPIKPHREDSSFLYNGLDRFDNNLGYVESNIVPCCFICNKMKGVLTKEDFMDHLNIIFTRIG